MPRQWIKWEKTGVITIEEAKSLETTLDVVEGMQFDKGYVSPYMSTDMERMEANLENPYILITDKKNKQHERYPTYLRGDYEIL